MFIPIIYNEHRLLIDYSTPLSSGDYYNNSQRSLKLSSRYSYIIHSIGSMIRAKPLETLTKISSLFAKRIFNESTKQMIICSVNQKCFQSVKIYRKISVNIAWCYSIIS